MKVSDNTAISMPMRNLISIVITVAIGVWGYFGLVERITRLETSDTLFEADLLKKAQQEPKNLCNDPRISGNSRKNRQRLDENLKSPTESITIRTICFSKHMSELFEKSVRREMSKMIIQ